MATSLSKVQGLYNQWNDSLYNRYQELFPESSYTIWDGAISPDEYAKSRMKVMILNREPYDKNQGDYDLPKAIRDRIEKDDDWIFPKQNTLRTHLKQYLTVLDLGQNGFLSLSDEEVREKVHAKDYYEFIQLLKRVAYCNVKKSDGKPESNVAELKEYATKGLDVLKEQIRFFNPSIILAGNVCEGILEDLFDWGDNLYTAPNHRINIWQLKIGGNLFPFVDMYHPSYATGMSEYYLEFLHALQEVERADPDYWLLRLDSPCFQRV